MTIFVSGGFGVLQMVSKPDTERCASLLTVPPKGGDTRQCANKYVGPQRGGLCCLTLVGEENKTPLYTPFIRVWKPSSGGLCCLTLVGEMGRRTKHPL